MKVLVTGGAGFIGSHFVCNQLEQGHTVITVDKLTYAGSLENFESYKDHQNHFFYQNDICDKDALDRIFIKHQPDVVVHMAAESHVDRSIDNADSFIQTNIVGTYTLLNSALHYYRSSGTKDTFRFLHLSTDEVFGALGNEGKFNETMPYRPNSPYAASKASSDLLVRSYNKTYGLPTIIVNSSNNYGPKQYPEKLIPLTILNALEGKPLPVYGDGMNVRDWLYVADHIAALSALLKHGHIGQSYCVGAGNEITNLELVETIADFVDELKDRRPGTSRKLLAFVKDRPGHDFRYATDASFLKAHTGWQPVISFEDGIKFTMLSYATEYILKGAPVEARKRIGLG